MCKEGVIHASHKDLYVLPVNLLFISTITKVLYCSVTFFPFHCIFEDLQTERRIGLGREHGLGVYLLLRDDIPRRLVFVVSTLESSFIWYHHLSHPFHRKLQ